MFNFDSLQMSSRENMLFKPDCPATEDLVFGNHVFEDQGLVSDSHNLFPLPKIFGGPDEENDDFTSSCYNDDPYVQ